MDRFSRQIHTLTLLPRNAAGDNSANFSREGLNAGGASNPDFSNQLGDSSKCKRNF